MNGSFTAGLVNTVNPTGTLLRVVHALFHTLYRNLDVLTGAGLVYMRQISQLSPDVVLASLLPPMATHGGCAKAYRPPSLRRLSGRPT